MMSILVFLAILGAAGCIWWANGNSNEKTRIKCVILAIILFFFAGGGIISCVSGGGNSSSSSNKTKYDKEWIQDNFGNGQYDKIKDAINDYSGYN